MIFINIKLTDNDESGKIIKKLCRCRMGPIQPPAPLGGGYCGYLLRSACEISMSQAPWNGLYTTSHMSLNNTSNGTRCSNRFVSSYTHITCTHTAYQPCTITPHTLCTMHHVPPNGVLPYVLRYTIHIYILPIYT